MEGVLYFYLFIYLGFYVAFNSVQVISRRVVGRAEETSTYSSLGFCTVNCRPTASNYQLSHLRLCWGANPGLRGGRRECYHSATVAPRKVSYNFLTPVFSPWWEIKKYICSLQACINVTFFIFGLEKQLSVFFPMFYGYFHLKYNFFVEKSKQNYEKEIHNTRYIMTFLYIFYYIYGNMKLSDV